MGVVIVHEIIILTIRIKQNDHRDGHFEFSSGIEIFINLAYGYYFRADNAFSAAAMV